MLTIRGHQGIGASWSGDCLTGPRVRHQASQVNSMFTTRRFVVDLSSRLLSFDYLSTSLWFFFYYLELRAGMDRSQALVGFRDATQPGSR